MFFRSGHGRALGNMIAYNKHTKELAEQRIAEMEKAEQQRVSERQQALKDASRNAKKDAEQRASKKDDLSAGQRLQARKSDQAREENEKPEAQPSAVPAVSRPLLSRSHDGVKVGSDSKSISKREGKRCYAVDEVPPFIEIPEVRVPNDSPNNREVEDTMAQLGRSNEQLSRLETIYEHRQRPISE